MATIVSNCPRCGAKQITFDIKFDACEYISQQKEMYSVCRCCMRGTIFLVHIDYPLCKQLAGETKVAQIKADLTSSISVRGFVSLADTSAIKPPEHLPDVIEKGFNEAARCFAVGCYNASATMYRFCLDQATKELLPDASAESVQQPNGRQRRDLGLRLPWLIERDGRLAGLGDLASCIRDDGNDGAHSGSLSKTDAEDVQDFTFMFLERLYSEAVRLKLAADRRLARRSA